MSSEPPLCGGELSLGATELRVDNRIEPKVVFRQHRASPWVKIAAVTSAVDMQGESVVNLPEACCKMSANMSPDVHVFHLLAHSRPKEVNNVEVLKVTTDVVYEIDTMAWVVAGCSPVS